MPEPGMRPDAGRELERLEKETREARGQLRELRDRLFEARDIVQRLRAELTNELQALQGQGKRMKIFLDTADIGEIREASAMGLVDGVTTNPSLVAKTGRKFRDVLNEICDIVKGPVSAEVVSVDYDGMMKEARDLAKVAKNIVVKIP